MDWLVWDGLGKTWAGGRIELVQAGFGLVDKWVCERAEVTSAFWDGSGDIFVLGGLRQQMRICPDRPDSR